MKTGGVDVLTLDPDQIATLSNFRKWLTDNGVLFKPFHDQSSYEALLRVDLSKVATELSNEPTLGTSEGTDIHQDLYSDDDLGLLDYLDMQDAEFGRISELMDEQSRSIQILTESFKDDTEDSNRLLKSDLDRKAFKRLLRRSSQSWNTFSGESEIRLVKIQESTANAFNSIAMALSLGASAGEEAKQSLIAQLQGSIDSSAGAAQSTRSFRDSILAFPRMTVELNHAKRRLADVLGRWAAHFDTTEQLAKDILDSISS